MLRLLTPLLVLLLSACVPSQTIKEVETPISGQSIVFGSLEVIEDGERKSWGMSWSGGEVFRLLLLAPGSDTAMIYTLDKSGEFNWSLAPGEYTLVGYELARGAHIRSGRLWSRFQVAEGSAGVYLGKLTVSLNKGRFLFSVKDEYARAAAAFRKRYPSIDGAPQKADLQMDGGIGHYTGLSHICAQGWGIECSKSFTGIEPLQPSMEAGKFNTLESLTPHFQWKPSNDPQVSYDLLIHEVVRYSRGGMDTQRMPGRVAFYAENLQQPSLQLQQPLTPGREYYWSVRLRRGDTVSTWSTYSRFAFYLVAWSAGYGQWFSFATPQR